MKTISFYSLMLLVAMVLCGGLAACSDDEGGEEEEVKTTGQFDFSFSLGSDLLELADVEVVFIDAAGNKTTEQVTVFPWEKTVTFDEAPATAGYQVNITPKTGVELDKDSYQISETYRNYFYTLQDGNTLSMRTLIDNSSTLTVPKENVALMLERMSSEVYAYQVDANFACTETELDFE